MTVFIISLPPWIFSWAFPTDIWSILGTITSAHPFLWKALRELFSVFQLLIFSFVLFLKPHYCREFNRQSFYIYNPYLRIISKEKRHHSVSENTSFCLKILFGHKCSFYFLKAED